MRRGSQQVSGALDLGIQRDAERAVTDEEAQKGFGLTGLWRGETPLWAAYWVFGLGGALTGRILLALAELSSSRALFVFVSLVVIVYSILVLVGIWRSAGHYQGRRLWASLARIAVVLNVLGLLAGLE